MERTIPKAIYESLLKYAKEGNAECQNYIGYYILQAETPEGVEIHEDPVELIRQSAEKGWPAAQYNMGLLYEEGYYVDKDEQQAFEWYNKAAQQGSTEGMTAVGMCYYNGSGVQAYLKQALSWLTKAAEEGDMRAQLLLAEIYAKDERCKNKNKALHWFCKVAKKDPIREAELRQFVLVPPYYDQVPPEAYTEPDWYPPLPEPMTEEKFQVLLEKAKQGNVIAMCHVADCYKVGNGTEKNIEQMIYWGNKYLDEIHKRTQNVKK